MHTGGPSDNELGTYHSAAVANSPSEFWFRYEFAEPFGPVKINGETDAGPDFYVRGWAEDTIGSANQHNSGLNSWNVTVNISGGRLNDRRYCSYGEKQEGNFRPVVKLPSNCSMELLGNGTWVIK